MSARRSARLELRVTPAQKELISRGAAVHGKTLTEYALAVLVSAAARDAAQGEPPGAGLGWMRGTATIVGDIVGPTSPAGWDPADPAP